MKQTILIASDHRGLALKEELKSEFKEYHWHDLGPFSSAPVDYPDYAEKVCKNLKESQLGVLICSSGQGMSMKANRFPHVRAALCWNPDIAHLARQHNNANILCLPGTMLPFPHCFDIFKSFVESQFEAGRHQSRVNKL